MNRLDERVPAPANAPDTKAHVVIVGGGITGLSAAWYLQQSPDVRYTLLEQSERWGGKIRTEHVEDAGGTFVVEAGPDSFLTQKPWALQLSRELGLDEQLLGTNDAARKVFVLNNGKPTPMPDGVLMIVPTKFTPFALSTLISPLGKLRMGMDLLIPKRQDSDDETLADFIRRRLGSEALDKIAEPMMSGIYNAEAERQSLLATFPRFRELEMKHGSLIKGMLASRRNGHTVPQSQAKPVSVFTSFNVGTETLVQTLSSKLTGDLRLRTGVQSIERTGKTYRLTLSDGSTLEADAVILAVPAYIAANLIRPITPQAATDLDSIRYVSTGTLSLAFKRDEVQHPLNGFGVVIPRSERRPINAITWSSTKFNHRAPNGYVLMRVFFGGSRNPGAMELDDQTLLTIARSELKALLGIDATPVFHRIYRWHRANPQYDVGHLAKLDKLEAALPDGLYVTGSPYRGVGIPDCVNQAQQTVKRVLARVTS